MNSQTQFQINLGVQIELSSDSVSKVAFTGFCFVSNHKGLHSTFRFKHSTKGIDNDMSILQPGETYKCSDSHPETTHKHVLIIY